MKVQQWRKKAESLYDHLPEATEDDLELKRDMRFVLDDFDGYHYPPFFENENEMEWMLDEDMSWKTGMTGFDSAYDLSDDETMEEEDYLAYKATEENAATETAATETAATEESAEVDKETEKTQLGAVDEVDRDEGIVSPRSWSEAEARLPAASLGETQERPPQLIDDEDEEMNSGEKDGTSSQSNGKDDGDNDDKSMAQECSAYKATEQAAAAEKLATEKSAEVDKTTPKTQLGVVDEVRDESTISSEKLASGTADGTKNPPVARKTTVTGVATVTEEGGVTKKTVVSTKTVVTWEGF